MNLREMSVGQVDCLARALNIDEKRKLLLELQEDDRKGIINIAKRIKREIEDYNCEMERLHKLMEYENKYYSKGAKYIAGIDEVGRGPLAGPVYASVVIMPAECIIEGVNDSKKLSPAKRQELYKVIKENAIDCATGWCDESVIDSINILNATYEAMRRAVNKLSVKPQVLLIDAVRIPGLNIFQVPIVKGDSLSFSIACASIIAKVERDKYMDELHIKYPAYNFISNKGYGTKEHIESIKKFGPCPAHRRSFIGGIL